jgi:hypothetical protein
MRNAKLWQPYARWVHGAANQGVEQELSSVPDVYHVVSAPPPRGLARAHRAPTKSPQQRAHG